MISTAAPVAGQRRAERAELNGVPQRRARAVHGYEMYCCGRFAGAVEGYGYQSLRQKHQM